MIRFDLHGSRMKNADLRSWLKARLRAIPEDSIVKVWVHDTVPEQTMEMLSAPALRALAQATELLTGGIGSRNLPVV